VKGSDGLAARSSFKRNNPKKEGAKKYRRKIAGVVSMHTIFCQGTRRKLTGQAA